jgi:hypothetical protein
MIQDFTIGHCSRSRRGFADEENRETILWFELALTDSYEQWKGKLIVGWPPPERAWWRRAQRNEIPVLAILEESAIDGAMPDWKEIDLGWDELGILPACWRLALSQWRGIYLIFDQSDGKGYVGSAYGTYVGLNCPPPAQVMWC